MTGLSKDVIFSNLRTGPIEYGAKTHRLLAIGAVLFGISCFGANAFGQDLEQSRSSGDAKSSRSEEPSDQKVQSFRLKDMQAEGRFTDSEMEDYIESKKRPFKKGKSTKVDNRSLQKNASKPDKRVANNDSADDVFPASKSFPSQANSRAASMPVNKGESELKSVSGNSGTSATRSDVTLSRPAFGASSSTLSKASSQDTQTKPTNSTARNSTNEPVVDPTLPKSTFSQQLDAATTAEGAANFGSRIRFLQEATPNMIGGFHAPTRSIFHEIHDDSNFKTIQQTTITDMPSPGGPGLLVSENNTAIPRDRFFVSYSNYADVFRTSAYNTGTRSFVRRDWSVNKATFGFEKILPDDDWSIEVRVPFAGSLDRSSIYDVSGQLGDRDVTFGNVSIILKQLLYSNAEWAFTAGLGIETPTAPNARTRLVDYLLVFQPNTGAISENLGRAQDFYVENTTVRLAPFFAMMYTPNERIFGHMFFQVTAPTNRDTFVYTEVAPDLQQLAPNETTNFGPFTTTGKLYDQVLLHVDYALGCWIYRDTQSSWLTGIAPSIEFRHTYALSSAKIETLSPDKFPIVERDANGLSAGTVEAVPRFGNFRNQMSILSMTVGTLFEFNNQDSLSIGFELPLTENDNKTDDYQIQIQFNKRFGHVSPQ